MASWSQFQSEQPEFAGRARSRLDAHVHKTLATIRKDGAPRISGTELNFKEGEVWIGSMLDALKAHDLQRDPRYAVHSGSDDPPQWSGDAKFSGIAAEITDPDRIAEINGAEHAGKSHLFRLDLEIVTLVGMNDARDLLLVETWKPGEPIRTVARD